MIVHELFGQPLYTVYKVIFVPCYFRPSIPVNSFTPSRICPDATVFKKITLSLYNSVVSPSYKFVCRKLWQE